MDTSTPRTALKLPTAPYPGLRPFLDHEAALLLGRGRQIREIVSRLCETHFIAVIGGSGSGKSSLIRAGVVPELRGFGIPDAGDYWIPVVCTPGTTGVLSDGHNADVQQLTEQTPITRLAWKFSQQLEAAHVVLAKNIAAGRNSVPEEPIEPEAEAAHRRADIENVFRQSAGFARLVDSYFDELRYLGPELKNARFLFVIDQFEELFNRNNRQCPDARKLIEAVIDHFFKPHPHCYVILTMRSEHLADCASYLELPDAINKSSYLVRRLDRDELEEAIVGPAKYFLRLIHRGGAVDGSTLPDDIVFDKPVIERLLHDVGQMTGNPDHLPLLQHVLARVWQAACEREHVDGQRQLPAAILWSDLEQAVAPGNKLSPGWLREDASVVTLRDSLENWASFVYRERTKSQQLQIDVVLGHLAYKDPNNGLYSQQRVEVDRHLFPDVGKPKELLHDLLQDGLLDTVNYLFWDDENPDNVTLKVSHEALIRGWAHFRAIVDAEAAHFEEFVVLLRKCLMWVKEEEGLTKERYLLEISDFERLDGCGLTPVLEPGEERQRWFGVLPDYHDGERLAKVQKDLDSFVNASRVRQDRIQAERSRSKSMKRVLLGASVLAVFASSLLAPLALLAVFVLAPAMSRMAEFSDARNLVERNGDKGQYSFIGEAGAKHLKSLVVAANVFDSVKTEERTWYDGLVESLTDTIDRVGVPMIGTKRLLALTSSEPVVNGNLRRMLTNVAWPIEHPHDSKGGSPPSKYASDWRSCGVVIKDKRGKERSLSLTGNLFRGQDESRGIFVASSIANRTDEITLYDVVISRNGDCEQGSFLWSLPDNIEPMILFDASTSHMAVASGKFAPGGASVSLYYVTREPSQNRSSLAAKIKFRSVVTDVAAVELIRKEMEAGDDLARLGRSKSVETWSESGGSGVLVAGQRWRLFSEGAERVNWADDQWVPIGRSGPGCERLQKLLGKNVQPGFESEMFESGGQCFEIQHGNPEGMEQSGKQRSEQILVAVYRKPLDAAADNEITPSSISSLSSFGRFAVQPDGTESLGQWFVGQGLKSNGWIALRQQRADGSSVYEAAPWSTSALKRIGEELLSGAPSKSALIPGVTTVPTSLGSSTPRP